MWVVVLTKKAQKEFDKAPVEIQESFVAWQVLIEASGPHSLQLINGFRDHSLKGEWAGARASSLSRLRRVIYRIEAHMIQVAVLRISAHD